MRRTTKGIGVNHENGPKRTKISAAPGARKMMSETAITPHTPPAPGCRAHLAAAKSAHPTLAAAATHLREVCPSCCAALLAEGALVDSRGEPTTPNRLLPSHYVAFADGSVVSHDATEHWNDADRWLDDMHEARQDAARDYALRF